ncbi:MAG: bifunctional folylpolyglutamate synthase/dihydrofolate synthase [Candidatus Marinimicrobia bacterium]|nr:bifunctional folylpolyglutamate synthase/dihydrofolate synthase [Candidatus Neomarinimicrobiota bacterium]
MKSAPDRGPSSALAEAIERMFQRRTAGIQPGLDIIRDLAARLGDPQHAFAVIHVAGTNGKGSVAAMLAAILTSAGLRTGLYTSPHLVRFNERFLLDGQPVADDVLGRWLAAVEAADGAGVAAGRRPATFFELATAMAFYGFREQAVQIAVIETGMGGRWDATNIVRSLVSVITQIDLDHQEYLGPDLASIAGEKAGIIKPGRPVVLGALPPEADEVVTAAARAAGVRPLRAPDGVTVRLRDQTEAGLRLEAETPGRRLGTLRLALLGRYQAANCAVVLTALEALAAQGLEVPEEAIREGLERVRWPARCQWLGHAPPVLLDGAHNPSGARALAQTLRDIAGKRPVVLLLGVLADKDVDGILRAWQGLSVGLALATDVPNERGLPRDQLAARARVRGWPVEGLPLAAAWTRGVEEATRTGAMLVIAGSLYLAGAILARQPEALVFRAPARGAS